MAYFLNVNSELHNNETLFSFNDNVIQNVVSEDKYFLKGLAFDKDWNWLMAIGEKINQLSNTDGLNYSNFFINDDCFITIIKNITEEKKVFNYSTSNELSLIESTYKSCVDFIKWYNLENYNKTKEKLDNLYIL